MVFSCHKLKKGVRKCLVLYIKKKCYYSTLIYKSQNEVLHSDTRIVTEEFFQNWLIGIKE